MDLNKININLPNGKSIPFVFRSNSEGDNGVIQQIDAVCLADARNPGTYWL